MNENIDDMDNIEIDLEKALKRNVDMREHEVRASQAFIFNGKLFLLLENKVLIGEEISDILEFSDIEPEKLRPEIIGFGGTLHISETDIYISVDGLVKKIMKRMPLKVMRSIVASANGSMKSEKKAVTSARNGALSVKSPEARARVVAGKVRAKSKA